MQNFSRTNKGFTLIETMIMLFVLAVGILGVAAMQYSAIFGNTKSNHVTEATSVATDQIEIILGLSANDPLLADNDNTNFQRMGIPVTAALFQHPGATPGGNNTIRLINDVADNTIVYQEQGYTVFYDGEPIFDPIRVADQVGIDFRLYVVWNDGGQPRTLEMFFTKLI